MSINSNGEVTYENHGRQYGATYAVSNGMLQVKTHTETRSVELKGQDPKAVAQRVLAEIVKAQPDK